METNVKIRKRKNSHLVIMDDPSKDFPARGLELTPQMLSPPVPSPCGSPVWIMKPWPDHALWTLQVVHRNQLHTEKARGNRTKLMALDFGNKLSAN